MKSKIGFVIVALTLLAATTLSTNQELVQAQKKMKTLHCFENGSCVAFCSTDGDTTFCFTKKACNEFRADHDGATKCKKQIIHD